MKGLSPEERKNYKREYRSLLFSELLIALMEEDEISVRRLAELAKISPTIIQKIRSGKKKNITLETLVKITSSFGYSLILERQIKGESKSRIILNQPQNGEQLETQLKRR